MINKYKLEDINSDGFLHSRIYEVIYDSVKKIFKINFGFADLLNGGALIDCTITVSDWWELEVIEKGKNIDKKYSIDEIPIDIDQIFKYEYDGSVLILKACGSLEIDSVIYYKFTKPNIHITGEYEPD